MTSTKPPDLEAAIIGAGISGINTAYRLQTEAPSVGTSYAIFEARPRLGGTWDLFRYPGIRSDSDILSFGLPWKAWPKHQTLAAGPDICSYLTDAARESGIDKHIHFNHTATSARWDSKQGLWTVEVVDDSSADAPITKTYTARYLILGTGYYNYATPLETTIPGLDKFTGRVVHPQFWPSDLVLKDQRVVIVGSGATAITLLPSLLKPSTSSPSSSSSEDENDDETPSHVTMLQRSPSYIIPLPPSDAVGNWLRFLLPAFLAYRLCRLWNITRGYLLYYFCTTFPVKGRGLMKKVMEREMAKEGQGPKSWDPHFKPRYSPWEQRLCVSPGGDFFAALRSGKGSVVTDTILGFDGKKVLLGSGGEGAGSGGKKSLDADILVTATGLKLRFAGGMKLFVDGDEVDIPSKFVWKGCMVQDIPNLFFVMGYGNASWTLGADVAARIVLRLVGLVSSNSGAKGGKKGVVPRLEDPGSMRETPLLDLSSTYLKGANTVFPKGGTGQWKNKSNYFRDIWAANYGDVTTGLEVL